MVSPILKSSDEKILGLTITVEKQCPDCKGSLRKWYNECYNDIVEGPCDNCHTFGKPTGRIIEKRFITIEQLKDLLRT